MIAPTADAHVEPLFYMSEMLIKLAAQISQQMIVGGLQQEFPGFGCCVQDLGMSQPRFVHQAASVARFSLPRREFGNASVIATSTN